MAQVSVAAPGPRPLDSVATSLSEDQRRSLEQYEKIIRLRDAIFSGKHPSIKPPATVPPPTQPEASINPPPPAEATTTLDHPSEALQPLAETGQQQGLSAPLARPTIPSSTPPTAAKPFATGNTEINPIFLEKSEDLIRAEIQLQRQRIERALREEVDQRRAAAKNAAQGEPLADFDLSDVLSKALTLVQATSAPPPADPPTDQNLTAANQDAASDSFDDDTFYSSRHDTPESNLTSRVPNESEEAQLPVVPDGQGPLNLPTGASILDRPVDPLPGSLDSNQRPYSTYADASTLYGQDVPQTTQVPGLGNAIREAVALPHQSQNASGQQSRSEEPGNAETARQDAVYGRGTRQHPSDSYVDNHPPSPLVHSHQRSPIVPQPPGASLIPLDGSRPVPATEPISVQSSGTPAQVAALRNERSAATSPDSSPSGGRAPERKKGKKKKRKADRQVPEAEKTPYIKAEPRSASPLLDAPPYIRPNKRPRNSQRQLDEVGLEEIAYESHPSTVQHEPYLGPSQRDDRVPMGYERRSVYPPRPASTVVLDGPQPARGYLDERPMVGDHYVVRPASPYGNAERVVWRSSDGRKLARPQGRVQDEYEQPPRSHRETYETTRVSLRPDVEPSYMGPPRPPPTRIVVDAYGREYIEPPRPTIIRHSVAPPVRPGDPEVIYERTVPRAMSRQVGAELYEESAPVYRRASPTYMPRRVVTQPEYLPQDYRDQPPREYSTRPVVPAGEYVEVMAPPERRHPEELAPREYISRAASMRPAEPIRYEVPRDYGRVQSVRPEVPVRHYPAGVHPESRRETAQPYLRDYGPRPMEPPVVRREYSMRPVEQYYEQPMRGEEDMEFIEDPRRPTQEVVYADETRRDVYR